MSRNIVKSQESKNGQYRIQVMYDECPMCPCTDWDMVGCFLFEYSHSNILHIDSNWREIYNPKWDDNCHSLEDAVRTLVSIYVDEENINTYIKENCADETLDELDVTTMVDILQKYGKDIVVKEFALNGYSQGDYIEGVAFTTKERYTEFANKDTTDWEEKAIGMIDEDTECVNRWMWGDVYGYTLEEKRKFTKTYEDGATEEDFEWNEIDSCWGFFCEPDEVINENLPEI